MADFEIEDVSVIDVPSVEYPPFGKWYGEGFGGLLQAIDAPQVVRYVLKRSGHVYVWPHGVDKFGEATKKIRIARSKLKRLAELQTQRAEEIRNLTAPFEQAIEASRQILDIEENWDEEGSPAYSEATWLRATGFIRHVTILFLAKHMEQIPPPKITPGPDGSIDIRWKTEKRTMLLNFPADESAPADFFGHDKGRDTIKGTLDLASQNQWLLVWLTR